MKNLDKNWLKDNVDDYTIENLERIKNEIINIDDIDETLISNYLYTKNIPDPDFIIRTSGENRLSNFLMYQASYSELYFTNILWPDFSKEDFKISINEYSNRIRRFGGL